MCGDRQEPQHQRSPRKGCCCNIPITLIDPWSIGVIARSRCASRNQAPQYPRHGENVVLPHLRPLNPPVGGRMIDRHAKRLMVAYLHLELAAMYGAEFNSTSEAPLRGVDANRHNHVRLAADDVSLNCQTITLDLPSQRLQVARLVVDAHVP